MATLADALRGYQPPTTSALGDPIVEHFRTLPQQIESNQRAMDKTMAGMYKTNFGTGQPNPNYYPEAMQEFTENYAPNFMGTFIGAGSKLWNPKKAFEAAKMLKQGVSPEEVWKATGTAKGLDEQFRQEISDAAMKFNPEELAAFRRKRPTDFLNEPWKQEPHFLYHLVDHPELKQAYPASADTLIERGIADTGGSSSPHPWSSVTLNVLPARNTKEKLANIPEMESTLLHELQHQVQSAEGFAKGGSVEDFKEIIPPKDVLNRLHKLQAEFEALPRGSKERIAKVQEHYKLADKYTPFGQYERLAGEAEARTTSRRQHLTDEQRREHYPFKEGQYGLDVPLEDILIRQFGEPVISRKELIEQQLNKVAK